LRELGAQRLHRAALADGRDDAGGQQLAAACDACGLASSARSTVRSSLARDMGFSTKSKAPSRVASTAVSTVP
jgi:hypothetical protein